jgi:hypothetical protein
MDDNYIDDSAGYGNTDLEACAGNRELVPTVQLPVAFNLLLDILHISEEQRITVRI